VSDSIFLVGDDGSLAEAAALDYATEAELQKLLADHVHLLTVGAENPIHDCSCEFRMRDRALRCTSAELSRMVRDFAHGTSGHR
jgi:hypothetical protein